jgi:putative chitinase
MITIEDLQAICPHTKRSRLELFLEPLNAAMNEFEIRPGNRQQMFLPQVAHESMGFVYTREIWGPTPQQAKYDVRADLGNTRPEAIEIARRYGSTPGRFWAGHGLIQTTGYDNHCKARDALAINCVEVPELLCEPVHAARSAALFWKQNGCNEIADAGDFQKLTRRINGGLNGLDDRLAYLERAQVALA